MKMANEKRLIDANALHQSIAFAELDTVMDRLFITDMIHEAPTVDAVEVPCKVGDLVWGIKKFNRGQKAIQSVVTQMYFGDEMRLGIVVKGVCHGEWGKNVFATEEEALAKMDGERKDNG
jgi:hypothetical protein